MLSNQVGDLEQGRAHFYTQRLQRLIPRNKATIIVATDKLFKNGLLLLKPYQLLNAYICVHKNFIKMDSLWFLVHFISAPSAEYYRSTSINRRRFSFYS